MAAIPAKQSPYNLLSALQKAQTTLEHYNVGGTLVIDEDALEQAEKAVVHACGALTGVQTLLMTRDWDEATCLEIAKLITAHGAAVRARNDDAGLSACELADKYAGEAGTQSEHPSFTASDWQAAVWDSHTRLGYWDWVVEQIAGHTTQDLRLEL